MNTEKKIQKTLEKVMENKTTIIVAQRLSTIKNAKHIIVLDTGKIVESGTYEELLNSNGSFARLIDIQKKIETEWTENSFLSLPEENSKLETAQKEALIESPRKVVGRITKLLCTYWDLILISLTTAFIAGVTIPMFSFLLTDDVLTLLGYNGEKIDDTRTRFFNLLILGLIVFFMFIVMIGSISRITTLFTYDLRYQSIYSLLYYDQKYYDKVENSPAGVSYRLGNDTQKISGIAGPAFALQALIMTSLIGSIVVAFIENAVFTAAIIPFLPLIIMSAAKDSELSTQGLVTTNLKMTTAIASDALCNIKTVKSFNYQKYFLSKYISASKNESKNVLRQSYITGLYFGLRFDIFFAMWGVMSWFGGYLIDENNMTVREMLTSYFCIIYSYIGFVILGSFVPDIDGAMKSAVKLFDMMDYQPEINADISLDSSEKIEGNIDFIDIDFKYEGREIMVLNKVKFSMKARSSLGITGTTGSGKSTIGQLLLRFYNPTGGEIYLDSKLLCSYNLPNLRNKICWVGQEPILFRGSILYNLQLANPNVSIDEIIIALNKAQASDIVEKYGINNDVGFRGSFLSGGQKQRIAIARALVRHPIILVLDEATSALDNLTEYNLQKCINDEDITVISIAHRLQTIQDYDQILMLEKGTVVERGTHEELIAIPNGFYQRLHQSS